MADRVTTAAAYSDSLSKCGSGGTGRDGETERTVWLLAPGYLIRGVMRTSNLPATRRARRTVTTTLPRHNVACRGFTLMEASLAVLIVGVGFLAVMELFGTCTTENQRSAQLTTAQMLSANIQEMMGGLAFKDPYYSTTTWGAESGEALTTFNDVD